MIQLTTEEAKEILKNLSYSETQSSGIIDSIIDNWKQKGWIKKSAVEEYESYCENTSCPSDAIDYAIQLHKKAVNAISELQQKIKELEEK